MFGSKNKPQRARVLKAAGMRIKPENREQIAQLSLTKQAWQPDAWQYRDMIGELRFASQFRARAVSRVKYFPAQIQPEEDEPIPLDSDKGITVAASLIKAAQEEMDRLPLNAGYSFLGVMDENLGITGECWLHGYYDQETGDEKWEALSVDEVQPGQDGRMHIRRFGTLATVAVDLENEEMLRVWVPHPRYKILADSPMKALMTVCEEIVLNGREMRAASRSRFAANGLLLLPEGLALLNAVKEDETLVDDNEFMADLTAALLAPISNEGDPGAIAPVGISGAAEDLKEIRLLRLERETSTDLLAKIESGLARLGRGLDIPPEIITGVAQANHWTAWQIDISTYRHHIDPAVRIISDSLTEAFLRPALIARGFSAEDVRQITVWYDAGNITENPNRSQDAKDAFDRGAIGFEALADALGFNEADAPDDEELLRMAAFRIGSDPATAGVLLQTLLFPNRVPVEAINKRVVDPNAKENVAPTDTPKQITSGQPPATPEQATPNGGQAPSPGGLRLFKALMAAGAPAVDESEWFVDDRFGRQLMDIDRSERDRILFAADAALTRGLEKAGARIRSKAQKSPEMAARLSGVDVFAVGKLVGKAEVLALGLSEQELVAEALDALEEKFRQWTLSSISRTVRTVLSLLRVKAGSARAQQLENRLRTALEPRVDDGWTFLRAGLGRLATRYLFNPNLDLTRPGGEAMDVRVPPSLVRGALALVGGTSPEAAGVDADGNPADRERPIGGVALGEEVSSVLRDEGAQELGFEWVYGITQRNHFEPHMFLDGERFDGWNDPRLEPDARYAWVGPTYHPGDHNGCMCDYAITYAVPAVPGPVRLANAARDRILTLRDRWMNRSAA